jgi:PilZ domain-containing protein
MYGRKKRALSDQMHVSVRRRGYLEDAQGIQRKSYPTDRGPYSLALHNVAMRRMQTCSLFINPFWSEHQPFVSVVALGAGVEENCEMLEVVPGGVADRRSNDRSKVFLAATLVVGGSSHFVRVRNISDWGALLDGSTLPPEGSSIDLRRGSLTAVGEVAWQEDGQCGIRFDTDVIADDWVRGIENRGQERVDQLVSIVRNTPTTPISGLIPVENPRADSLELIGADLTKACERLANVPKILAEHESNLLELDAIAQRLGHFSKIADQKAHP